MSTQIHYNPASGPRVSATLPHHDADHVTVPGACPNCGATPFAVAGVKGSMVTGHDTMISDAGCTACKRVTGRLVVTVSTIFGIREDQAVLQGRCRVY